MGSLSGTAIVMLIDTEKHTVAAELESLALATALAYSPDGTLLAAGYGDGNIRLWDLSTGKQVMVLQAYKGSVSAVKFSPDGSLLASSSIDYRNERIRVWNVTTGKNLNNITTSTPVDLAFSPDGLWIAVASIGQVGLWHVRPQEGDGLLPIQLGCSSVEFDPSGTFLACTGREQVWLLDVAKQQVLGAMPAGDTKISYADFLAISANGVSLAAASGSDPTLYLWDVLTGEIRFRELKASSYGVKGIAFNADGTLLFSNTTGLEAWDVDRGEKIFSYNEQQYFLNLAISPDGTQIAASGSGNKILLLGIPGE